MIRLLLLAVTLQSLAAAPIALWRLDDLQGTAVADSAGTHPGTASGQVTFRVPGPLSNTYAARFGGGSGTQIEVPCAGALNPAQFTISCWARVTGGDGTYRSPVTSRNGNPLSGYLFYVASDNRWQFWMGIQGGYWQALPGSDAVSGQWTLLTGTFDGSRQCFYVNGQLVNAALASFQPNTARPLRIGAGGTESTVGCCNFQGDIAEVALYDHALTATQVREQYPFGTNAGTLDLSTTNRLQLPRFWNAVERSNGPVTVLAFGDSMAQSWLSIQKVLFTQLQAKLGVGGYSLQNFNNNLVGQFSGGAASASPSANWWTTHSSVPPGGSVFWKNSNSGTGSVLADRVGLFWVAHPGGGSFTLSVSTNGGPWSQALLTLDGYSSTPRGRHAALSLPRQGYQVRVDGLAGTNLIVGPQYVDGASAGIHVAFMAEAGINLEQVFSVSTNVLYPILSALNPQLVVWHMKEVGDIGVGGLGDHLPHLEALWGAGVTNGEVVYLGTPYEARDMAGDYTPLQNGLVRQAAVENRRCYVDCMTPCVSYAWMTNHEFMMDTIHLSTVGNDCLATNVVWPQLGFFALRAARSLEIRLLGKAARLEWPTTAGILYELQSSSNLVAWTTQERTRGDGNRHACTNTTGPYFRLSLTSD